MSDQKTSNGKLSLILPTIGLVVGLVIGSMGVWINATDRFVQQGRYDKDIERLEKKIDQLLRYHLAEEHNP